MSDARRVMRDFWDEKAKENAMYYISSYRDYDDQDPEEFWRWGETLTERFLSESEIPFAGDERVLEIGCGIGRMTAALARRFREVEGIDVSEEMVRRAREALGGTPNARVSVANGVDLAGFADGSFDFVFSYLVFQHIPDPEITTGYLREIGRVLPGGGWMHVQVNGEGDAPGAGGAAEARGAASGSGAVSGGGGGAGATQGGSSRASVGPRLRRLAGRAARALGIARRRRGPSGLDCPAWRGSRLRLADVRRVCAEASLDVVRTRGEGTQYLWVTARKRDVAGARP